ncbi:MAG: hypothetical protein EZS28_051384, partial [Streblomastix strix]
EQPQEEQAPEEEIQVIDRGEVFKRYVADQEEQPDANSAVVSREFKPIGTEQDEYEYVKGKVSVTLHRLSDLPANDINGKSDPYVIFKLGDQEYKSKTISNSLNPEYEESFELPYDPTTTDEKELKVEVWDFDRSSDDDVLGKTTIKFAKYLENQKDIELDLVGTDKQNQPTNAGKGYLTVLYQRDIEEQVNEKEPEPEQDKQKR